MSAEGEDFASLKKAREDALFCAKQMIAESLRAGAPIDTELNKVFEVTDGEGQIVATVPFAKGASANLKGASRQWADED